MVFKTVHSKVVRVLLALLLAGTLLSPVVSAPVFAGECPTSGSTTC